MKDDQSKKLWSYLDLDNAWNRFQPLDILKPIFILIIKKKIVLSRYIFTLFPVGVVTTAPFLRLYARAIPVANDSDIRLSGRSLRTSMMEN
jgi:hypothetical protein